MSAWMISDAHVDLVASAYVQFVDASANAQSIGAMLIGENAQSICYRYSHYADDCAEARAQAAAYEYRPWGAVSRLMLLKALACLDYQSCEHDGWQTSAAKRIVSDLEAEMKLAGLPEYGANILFDDLPWGIQEEHRPGGDHEPPAPPRSPCGRGPGSKELISRSVALDPKQIANERDWMRAVAGTQNWCVASRRSGRTVRYDVVITPPTYAKITSRWKRAHLPRFRMRCIAVPAANADFSDVGMAVRS